MLKFKFINRFFLLALIGVVALIWLNYLPLTSILWIFLVWLVMTFLGSTNVRWNYFFDLFHKNPVVNEKLVALTFDDGPSENTIEILKILKKYDAKATFFCIGHKIDTHPDIFKKIVDDGHVVGNHTYSHEPMYGFFKTDRVEREILSCNKAAKIHAGVEMNLFRSPFGVTNPNIKRALKRTGHQPIGWSVRSFDALFSSEKIIFNAITRNLKKGDVVLMHDIKPHSLAILEQLLLFLRERDYQTTTIDALFDLNAYR